MAPEYCPAMEDVEHTLWESATSRIYTIGELDMGNPRASRKSTEQWAGLKAIICKKYKTQTLEELIKFLNEEHRFVVTKRQLVYRLGIWKCAKYNQSPKGSSEEIENADDNEITDTLGAISLFEGESYADDGITHDIQAANAIFAAAGGVYAWEAYNKDFFDNMEDTNRLVALCRSAETIEQCRTALALLESRILQPSGHQVGFWCLLYVHVLESMNDEMRSGNNFCTLENPIKEKLCAAVQSTLADSGEGFFLKEDGSVDLFAFHLLDTVCEKYHTLLSEPEEENLHNMLDSIHGCVLSAYDGGMMSRALATLKQCAEWCHLTLGQVSSDLDQTRLRICSAHNESQRDWKTYIEVYGTLWYRLIMQQLTEQEAEQVGGGGDAGGIEWSRNARRDLGISHAELLSCVCWVVVTFERSSAADVPGAATTGHDGPGLDDDHDDDSPESLFRRVQIPASRVLHARPSVLWGMFLRAFKEFNDLTITDGGDGADASMTAEYGLFRDEVMGEFERFVRDALKEFERFASGG
ncbi:hypothetical protein CORC01_02476 [Colletotrichum orchidophilum]|uniref:Clr5 domain-containing protein n=1 Tax=Colletotrichum orchidophilum TaxID=1209926 RepID=A0A1G4BLK6_9PEZI|nr:uncharacterized protein CORC01_02476 [Colletotrichum orchidophilum]OHF02196.1 hypothetical protein CORC01_02476 [Colletotrichum orchidophilum]